MFENSDMLNKLFQRISQAPTNPHAQPAIKDFDVADLYRGPAAILSNAQGDALPLDEKLRQAYFWDSQSCHHQPLLRHRV